MITPKHMEIAMAAQVRWACPENGKLAPCEVCEEPRRHRCEALAPEGKAPTCPTHRIVMVRAD